MVDVATLVSIGSSVPGGRVTGGNDCDSVEDVTSEVCSFVIDVGVSKSLTVEVTV